MGSILDKKTYRTQHRQFSRLFDQQENGRGRSYDRKQVLEFLNEHADRDGFLTKNQRELAKLMGVSYQRLCVFISEFCEIGYMKKYGQHKATKIRVMHHPDDCDWGPEYQAKVKEIRSRAILRKEGKETNE